MRAQLILVILLAPLMVFIACVTHPSAQKSTSPSADKTSSKGIANKPIAKEGQKTLSDAESNNLPQTQKSETPLHNLAQTLSRLSDISHQLIDADINHATSLHPASKGSLEEAVLIVAQLRLLKIQVEHSSKFQSRDLYETSSTTESSTAHRPSLQKVFQELDIDLASSLKLNSQLKSPAIITLIKSLLDHTTNSSSFTSQLQNQLDHEVPPVVVAQPKANPPSNSVSSNSESATQNTAHSLAPADTTAVGSNEVQIAATDLKRSDSILLQAQKFADKGEFRQAIDQAARIENRDPFFEQAKEKIKIFSNRAVQDLRKKAALAFQNAMPVTDGKAKSAYLKQAKELLELALKEFPTADQLDIVRDNLAVITRDLSGLELDAARDGSSPQPQ